MTTSTDRIERQVLLKAPRSRVWLALSQVQEFNRWFGVALEGTTMKAGETLKGHITNKGYEHLAITIVIERVEPERMLSWLWHPGAIEAGVDYSAEPMTRVIFELHEAPGGTRLTVVETGFDALPAHRRETALRLNSRGWEIQMNNIEKHVTS